MPQHLHMISTCRSG